MAELAASLRDRGSDVRILTARWRRDWPRELTHRGVHVVRLDNPALRFYGTWRYMQKVSHWLRMQAGTFDLLYVSMLKHDAFAALQIGKRLGVPVVLRAEGAGPTGDASWQQQANFGRRIARACKTADAIVAPSPAIEQELAKAGYAADRVHLIANGVRVPTNIVDEPERHRVRQDLRSANETLDVPKGESLAVFTGRLHPVKGLDVLIDAWALVSKELPLARLWIVGEGPEESALRARIGRLNLDGRVLLAGTFDTADDLLAAANLFVLPSFEEGMSLALLEAMAAGVPVVATDIPGNRNVIQHDRHGLLVPPAKPAPLADAIVKTLSDRTRATDRARAARQRVIDEFSIDVMTDRHLTLFQKLLAARTGS